MFRRRVSDYLRVYYDRDELENALGLSRASAGGDIYGVGEFDKSVVLAEMILRCGLCGLLRIHSLVFFWRAHWTMDTTRMKTTTARTRL